jgi:hypothetical protein
MVLGELEESPIHQWNHHAVSYDVYTGLLTLYRKGSESNLA